MLLLDRPFDEAQLSASEELDLRNIGSKIWPSVLSSVRASSLRLYRITLASLEGIERLSSVRSLSLEWAPKIVELSPLFKLRQLTSLSIFDFAKIRTLEGIEVLNELAELNLSGSRGALTPRLKITSVVPVTQLRRLVSLSLTNAQLDDDDISVLARCSNLKHLHLSRQFQRDQVAYLAKHLNGQLAEPLSACSDTNLKCESCGADKFMFAGRRMPILCRSFDQQRFKRYLSEFDRLVRAA
jgi:hypothetical protein